MIPNVRLAIAQLIAPQTLSLPYISPDAEEDPTELNHFNVNPSTIGDTGVRNTAVNVYIPQHTPNRDPCEVKGPWGVMTTQKRE
mmetsp:Transcript_22865/g.35900  ORF Transcript_22865/g.35900 Transcript_22865/m.35900 type:complete len:84 (-) Transcript_22865:36-287(-)